MSVVCAMTEVTAASMLISLKVSFIVKLGSGDGGQDEGELYKVLRGLNCHITQPLIYPSQVLDPRWKLR
jgi:hypothetical protein